MSAADDMIEDRLARDLAIGDRRSAFVRRLKLDMAYVEAFEVDPPWFLDTDELAMRRTQEPWVRPKARDEMIPARVLTTLIDNIIEEP